MPLPPNVQPMRPGAQGGMPQRQPMPGGGMPQQGMPQNPNALKAKKLMLKAQLMMLEAKELMQGGGKGPQRPQQGQPPRR